MLEVRGTLSVGDWEETEVPGPPGALKVSSATYTQQLAGDVDWTMRSTILIGYRQDSTAAYCGFDRVTGHVDGRKGSFTARVVGTYGSEGLDAKVEIVRGSGTDGFAGVRGGGAISMTAAGSSYELNLEFDDE